MNIDIAKLASALTMLVVTALLPEGSPELKAVFAAVGDAALEPALKKLVETLQAKFARDQDSMSEEILRELKKRPGDLWLRSQLEARLAVRLSQDREFRKNLARVLEASGALDAAQKGGSVPPAAALHQLPGDIVEFTGRQEEVAALLAGVEQNGTAPSVLVVSGLGGSGKTVLAKHVAQLLRLRFPDIQLFVDLQGVGSQPMDPGDALVGFLRALNVSERNIPLSLEERAGLFRSLLMRKRALILLDNARDEEQVQPLLPGEPMCAVLITSRWSLQNLAGKSVDLHLKMLKEQDAMALLEHYIGTERVAAEPQAAGRILELCGGLPLAVRIAGGQLAVTGQKLYAYAAVLETARLRALKQGKLDVWASFMLSYWHLGRRGAHLFRLLGLFPGGSFTPEAAAALAVSNQKGSGSIWDRLVRVVVIRPEEMPELLNQLVDMQWLEPIGGGRYRLHDLMRVFAAERLALEKPKTQRNARLRLARWYAGQTWEMSAWLVPEKRARKLDEQPGWTIGSREEVQRNEVLNALTWFEMERANLLAAVQWAHQAEDWKTTWRLAENLSGFYNLRCHWKEWEQTHSLALDAARRAHNAAKEGTFLSLLGNVYRLQGRWDQSVELFQQALSIHRRKGNALGESIALNLLANVYRLQGRWDEAIALFQECLEINRASGNLYGESIALGGLGNVYRMQGRWNEALDAYQKSLEISVRRQDERGRCISLDNQARVHARLGRLSEAEEALEQSLSLSREFNLCRGRCIALRTLGEVRLLQERWKDSFDLLEESLELAHELEDTRCICQTLNTLGIWYTRQGQWEPAGRCFGEGLPLLERMGDRHGVGLTLQNIGMLHRAQGRVPEALQAWREALAALHPDSPEHAEVAGWLLTEAESHPLTN